MDIGPCDCQLQNPFTYFCIQKSCFLHRRLCSTCKLKHNHTILNFDEAIELYSINYFHKDKQTIKQTLTQTIKIIQDCKEKTIQQIKEITLQIDKAFQEILNSLELLINTTNKDTEIAKRAFINDETVQMKELSVIAKELRLLKQQQYFNKEKISQICNEITKQFRTQKINYELKSTAALITDWIKQFSLFDNSVFKSVKQEEKEKQQSQRKKFLQGFRKKVIGYNESACSIQQWPAGKLQNIESLILRNQKIETIPNQLCLFPNLKRLYLQQNSIKKINNLESLTQLQILNLNYNHIQKIQGLQKLQNLTQLYLYGNKIERIQNLNRLIHLQLLYLRNNQIEVIENLQRLANLKQLYLYGNPLKKTPKSLSLLNNLKEKGIKVGLSWKQ